MIRPLFLFVLLLTMGSAAISAQDYDSSAAPLPHLIACPAPDPTNPSTTHEKIVISVAEMTARKIRGEAPKYPPDAKRARVQGRVDLKLIISKSGDVKELCVIQGPALLQQASFDAVKTWKYEPITLNGQPVEAKTTVSVTFKLGK